MHTGLQIIQIILIWKLVAPLFILMFLWLAWLVGALHFIFLWGVRTLSRCNFLLFPSNFFLRISFAKSTTVFCLNIDGSAADKNLPWVKHKLCLYFSVNHFDALLIFFTAFMSYSVCFLILFILKEIYLVHLFELNLFCVCSLPVNSFQACEFQALCEWRASLGCSELLCPLQTPVPGLWLVVLDGLLIWQLQRRRGKERYEIRLTTFGCQLHNNY